MCVACGWVGGRHHISFTVASRASWGMKGVSAVFQARSVIRMFNGDYTDLFCYPCPRDPGLDLGRNRVALWREPLHHVEMQPELTLKTR